MKTWQPSTERDVTIKIAKNNKLQATVTPLKGRRETQHLSLYALSDVDPIWGGILD